MGDVGGQVLEVAIGLVFIFLALSLICSFVQELIATAFSWRAEFLERGIRTMLCDPKERMSRARRWWNGLRGFARLFTGSREFDGAPLAADVLASPFIKEKLSPSVMTVRRRAPSYLSGTTFALALYETLMRTAEGQAKPMGGMPTDIEQRIPDDPGLRRQLELLMAGAKGDLDRFLLDVETWYDDTMARVSGWYRRRVQVVLFVLGLIVAVGVNADAVSLTDRLWQDGAVRSALVQQANELTQGDEGATLEEQLEARGGALEAVRQFKLPLGWNENTGQPDGVGFGDENRDLLAWLGGILLTALALSFGAPFWFDALGKLGRLRVTGKRPSAP